MKPQPGAGLQPASVTDRLNVVLSDSGRWGDGGRLVGLGWDRHARALVCKGLLGLWCFVFFLCFEFSFGCFKV